VKLALKLLLLVGMVVVLMAPAPQRLLVLRKAARNTLAQAWDDSNPRQFERGFCGTFHVDTLWDQTQRFIVDSIWFVPPKMANPYAVLFKCPQGTATGHVHTPTTCHLNILTGPEIGTCALGGDDAWICEPSAQDRMDLKNYEDAPFAMVQCDRYAVVVYWKYPDPEWKSSAPPGH
jgi:hypothetical protein